jgi:hypothetical protein
MAKNWIDVDTNGLRKLLERRGKEHAIYELVQNAWDENVTKVEVTLARPVNGHSELVVVDDSPTGWHDLTHAYTMFAESSKKADPGKRGCFNLGEKLVLALCDEAAITTTTGNVTFDKDGRHSGRSKRETGSEFRGILRLKIEEWEQMCEATLKLIPPVSTLFNGTEIPNRTILKSWTAKLPTVIGDEEGNLRRTERQTNISIYEALPTEMPTLYEMGIPVVDIDGKYHVSVGQKVPLNMERDNVTPAYLKTVHVEVLNHTAHLLTKEDAASTWVRVGASDERVTDEAITAVLGKRFGENRVAYDPSDIGSNREAASHDATVVHGGSLSAGEWANARRAEAIVPAGKRFPTTLSGKAPDKMYERNEWTGAMVAYCSFVEGVSPHLVGHKVTLHFIRDPAIVEGCTDHADTHIMVNLAMHRVTDWHSNIDLMLHELAHSVVRSNDHLNHKFYSTVQKLGAKLTILAVEQPALFGDIASTVGATRQTGVTNREASALAE